MWDTIVYLLKVIFISAILYGHYLLIMRNSAGHTWNRFYLLGIFFASILIPLVQAPAFFSAVNPLHDVSDAVLISEGTETSITTEAGAGTSPAYRAAVVYGYLAVCLFFLVSLLMSFYRVAKLWRTGQKATVNNISIVSSTGKGTPFSFFSFIFWNKHIDMESDTGRKILLHEMTHMRQLHSLDRLLVNLVMIVAWINPVFWLVRRELFIIHEFIADAASVENHDADAFARMLLTAAFPVQYHNVTSHFFTSSIKRRLTMLTQQQKTRFGYIGRLLTLPLALLIFAAFSTAGKSNTRQEPVLPEGIGSIVPASLAQDTVIASFPGGKRAWVHYIKGIVDQHLDTLGDYGISGTIVVAFTVDENGSLSEFKTTKDDIPFLSELVTKALKEGPKWVPATVEGKNVKSIFKQPVTFRIDE